MKITPSKTLKEIASIIGAEFVGDPGHLISGFNEIHRVTKGDVVFVDHPKYYDKALLSKATTIIINKKVPCPRGKALIITDDPFSVFNKLTRLFSGKMEMQKVMLNPNAKIGKDTVIMPNVYIGSNVIIGEDCTIHPNVCLLENITIGNRVVIQAGTVIGSDAFYYKRREASFDRLLSCGSVLIEDDVEVGASCTIDRGVSDVTLIGAGTKIDNMVHIGHDSRVGRMCLIAAQVGIAGVVTLEDNVTLWGQVGIPSNLHIGKGAILLGQSAPAKSLEGNKSYLGSPASEATAKMREMVTLKKITEERSVL
jgi:UDP-3-O-[3-hydroxymyristoyl] glucosamine N-acyltransferase